MKGLYKLEALEMQERNKNELIRVKNSSKKEEN